MLPENVENIMDGICVKRKVLGQVKEEQQILVSITQRQLKFFGHIVRENNLERLVLEGKIDGSRSRGRQRKKYLDDWWLRQDAYGKENSSLWLKTERDSDA